MSEQLPRFQIFSGALKAWEAEGQRVLSTTASSTVEDLHGDDFTPQALHQMAASAKGSGMTIFLNHDYKVPQDVFGSTVDAEVTQRGMDKNSKPIWDLDLTISVAESNPKALETYEMVKKGTKLGVSIGALIHDYTTKDNGRYSISDVELLEASIVGIPANPRSWVRSAVKALNSLPPKEEECVDCEEDATPDTTKATWDSAYVSALPDSAFACIDKTGRHYPHHSKGGAVDPPHLRAALSRVGDPDNAQCGGKAKAHLEAHAKALGIGDDKAVEPELTVDYEGLVAACYAAIEDGRFEDIETAADALLTDFTTYEHGHAHEDDEEAGDSPALDSATERPTNPVELDDGGEVEPISLSGDALSRVQDALVGALTVEVKSLKEQIARKDAELRATRNERDEAIATVRSAVEVVERIARTPLGKKTSFVAPISDFREKLTGVYDEDFLKLLKEPT